MGIIIKEALANGRLTLNTMDQESAPIRTVLEQEASARNCGVDAIALAACLAQPFADVVLSGAVTEQQLRSNLRAQEVHLNTQSLDRLLATAYPPDDYWKYRRGMTWN
jgi:aryl-alcohol dehydrogenase-like predicted oxidoreductase